MKTKPLAAIDIGTNTFRLIIADVAFNPDNNSYSIKELFSDRIITRLGEGMPHNRSLKEEAIIRGINALKRFRDALSHHNVYKTSAVATSALREAENRDEFLRKAKETAGLDIRIISGEEEAMKTASGMLIDMAIPETALMVDIGGGSTELIFAKKGRPQLVRSIDLGVVYLAGKYMKHDPPLKEDLIEMGKCISEAIGSIAKPFFKLKTQYGRVSNPPLHNSKLQTLFIGTAGTITTLSAVKQGLIKFEHDKIHNSRMTRESVENLFSDITAVSSLERSRLIPFEPSRLDIIVPGTLILLKLMEVFDFREITVSDYGLREGILIELYNENKNLD
ncbi:MAG: Ppx/GppA family phosphatase [Nitrospirae bacterium]|nr:Ppx/GppA family phosphatase [Nitrospirota bacterium]